MLSSTISLLHRINILLSTWVSNAEGRNTLLVFLGHTFYSASRYISVATLLTERLFGMLLVCASHAFDTILQAKSSQQSRRARVVIDFLRVMYASRVHLMY